MYVVETGGIAVGLDTLSLFDGGRTIMFQALRVDARYRGCGVARQLSRAIMAQVPRTAARLRVTTRTTNAASIALHEKQGFSVRLRRGLMGFFLPPLGSAAAAAGEEKSWPHRPSRVRAQRLFELLCADGAAAGAAAGASLSPRLFPQSICILNWEAFTMDRWHGLANLLDMERRGWCFWAARTATGAVASISFGTSLSRVSDDYHTCSIYGAGDAGSFAAHAWAHLAEAQTAGDQYLLLKMDEELESTPELAHVVEQLRASCSAKVHSWPGTLVLLEKPLSASAPPI
jgi:hypothetical protein